MKNKVRKDGEYELFQTTKKHTILSLDQKDWYAVIKGQQGDMLVGSDSDHQRSKTLEKGKYILVEFEDDPEFRDIPHLFLETSKKNYEEWILPQELPTNKGDKVKLIKTKTRVDSEKIEEHVGGKVKV
jgi:tyrosine-protein phosphatase YwqE